MTHLRKIMLEELQRRHYSEATTQRYIRLWKDSRNTSTALPIASVRDIFGNTKPTLHRAKAVAGSVTNHLCALRFFYIQTLKKPWSIADTPYPRNATVYPPFSVRKKWPNSSMRLTHHFIELSS